MTIQTLDEFTLGPAPRRGFTSVEAFEFLKQEFPHEKSWMCWQPDHHFFSRIVKDMAETGGSIGDWKWAWIESSYPRICYRNEHQPKEDNRNNWAGAIRITGPQGGSFLFFSYLASTGDVGCRYFVSTTDVEALKGFSSTVRNCLGPKIADRIRVEIVNGADLHLAADGNEKIFLPQTMVTDIEQQVVSFFENKDLYATFGVRYRRGLLFVGAPGCGKTMMIRRLVRECHRRFKLSFWSINITNKTDEDHVERLFSSAAAQAPGMIILEDMDSLTKDSHIARASLLAQLDGLEPRQGLLVIGTTNNPEDIDPALMHRPSRFDRVWIFEVPDEKLRLEYFQSVFPYMGDGVVDSLAKRTGGWSFAYINELRTTAAILSMQGCEPEITPSAVEEAFVLLTAQFKSGKKNHRISAPESSVGFIVA